MAKSVRLQVIAPIEMHEWLVGRAARSIEQGSADQRARTEIALSYSESLLAVSHLVDLYGQARVVAFYRAVAGGQTVDEAVRLDPEAMVTQAFPRSLGVTEAQFVDGWRRYLRTLARTGG